MVRAARTRCWTLLTKVLNINGLRATQACCITTRSSWRIINITDVNHHHDFFDDHFITSTPWFSRKSLTIRGGLYGAEHYLGPGQDFRGRWLLSRVRDFVAAHVFALDCSWCRPAHPAHFCQHSAIQSIRWQMDRYFLLFPAHRHQGASHHVAYAPELVHRCDATWILTRQWSYSAASGRCPSAMTSCPLTAVPTIQ